MHVGDSSVELPVSVLVSSRHVYESLAYVQLAGLPEAGRLARALAHGFRPDPGWLAIGVAALIAYNHLR